MTARAPDNAYFSSAGFKEGLRLGFVPTPGVMAFGLVVGAAAAREGLTFVQNLAMNVFVCSGIAQLVALEIWPKVLTWDAAVGLAALTAIVGARLFLMSVSMRPWLGKLPAWQTYSSLYYLTDGNWLIAMRYRAGGGRDVAVYVGATAIIVGGWWIAISAGYLLASFVIDPAKYGLDLVMPVYFAAMLVPLWRGTRRAVGWAVAGIVAVVAAQLLSGWWFIILGAVAGAVVGSFLDGDGE